jgi:hypothetical protein
MNFESNSEIIGTVLAILSAILSLGSVERPPEEEMLLKGILPDLQSIASLELDPEVAQAASDVSLVLLTRSVSANTPTNKHKMATVDVEDISLSAFEKVVKDATELLQSASPAMRGLGVRNIIIALREPESPITMADRALGLKVLVDLLSDEESFVYLNAVHALGRLACSCPAQVFPALLDLLDPSRDSRNRSVLIEALVVILRRTGDLASMYAPACITACIKIIRCEKLVEIVGAYSDNVVNTEERSLLRQSAISLLAEACSLAGWTAMRHIDDILDVSIGILRLENPTISPSKYLLHIRQRELGIKYGSHTARRGAAFLIRYVLSGLHQKLFRLSDGRFLSNIISILEEIDNYPSRVVSIDGKSISVSEDAVVLFHSRCALGVLEDLQFRETNIVLI